MGKRDDRVDNAVDELNKRLSRAQRRLTRVVVAASVMAGLASAAWFFVELEGDVVAFRLLVAVFLAAAIGTMAVGGGLIRVLLRTAQRGWVLEISRKHAVSAEELDALALPFGGPPTRPGTSPIFARAAPAALGILLLTVGVGLSVSWEAALRVGVTVVSVLTTAMFWAYLGFRAPR